MEPNIEKQKRDKLISRISFIVTILVLCGVFWYLYQEQKNTIAVFQDTMQRLQQESEAASKTLGEMTKTLAATKYELAVIRLVCSNNSECKRQIGDTLQKNLLTRNSIGTFTVEGRGSGLNFYKYFLDPQKWESYGPYASILSTEMLVFIKAECPAKIYDRQGYLVSKNTYRIDKTNVVEIIFDEESGEIMCAWTENETTKQFQKID